MEKQRRVLVVEDEPDIRECEAEILQSEGYEVHTASDGREALERARGCRPDVILLDLMMPRMNGWQFVEEQARDPEISPIPVVVVSAAPLGFLRPQAHIRKPFDITELLAAIERVSVVRA